MCRVGQNHIYTVYIRYYLQGYHQIYCHIRGVYTVTANPMYVRRIKTAVGDRARFVISLVLVFHL